MGFILHGELLVTKVKESTTTDLADSGVVTFPVGGVNRTLKFTAAARYRLFLDIPNDQIQNYIVSDSFKINALSYLLYGKEYIGKTLEEVLERFEEDDLMDDEMEAIVGWVRQRTVNFMVKEAEQVAQTLKQVMPRVTELSDTLSGSQDSTSKK